MRSNAIPVLTEKRRDEAAAARQRQEIERSFLFGSARRACTMPGVSEIGLRVDFGPLKITRRSHTDLDARKACQAMVQAEVDLIMHGTLKNKLIAKEIHRTANLLDAP